MMRDERKSRGDDVMAVLSVADGRMSSKALAAALRADGVPWIRQADALQGVRKTLKELEARGLVDRARVPARYGPGVDMWRCVESR